MRVFGCLERDLKLGAFFFFFLTWRGLIVFYASSGPNVFS